jgi:hypothetical protein
VEKVRNDFPGAQSGVWFAYGTAGGKEHFCQTDILLDFPSCYVIVECKLSQKGDECWGKLRGLYARCILLATGRPTALVQCFKNATYRDNRRRLEGAEELLDLSPGEEAIWQTL